MLESIHLKNYRCFADTQIDDLKQITLISGKNNAECFLIQMLQPLIRDDTIFDSIQIWDFGGISQLSQTLRTLPPLENYQKSTALSILRDAETNYEAAVTSIQHSLREAKLSAPRPASNTRFFRGLRA